MHLPKLAPPIAGLFVLLLQASTCPTVIAAASTPYERRRLAPAEVQLPLGSRDSLDDGRRPWTRFRDSAVMRLSGRTKTGDKLVAYSRPGAGQNAQPVGLPAGLASRYSDHVVLRFNISTVDEAKSLAEATITLLLDVWESDDDWVDIRLSKDVVCFPSAQAILLHCNSF